MKTGGTCTLHKKIIRPQLGHTAREVEVQPLSPSLTLPLNSNPGTNVLCVLKIDRLNLVCILIRLFQMQTAEVTVYDS